MFLTEVTYYSPTSQTSEAVELGRESHYHRPTFVNPLSSPCGGIVEFLPLVC